MGPVAGAVAGFDCRVDEDGECHPWRMIAWRPTGSGDVVVRRTGSLPGGRRWLSVPRDPLYGDLLALPDPPIVDQAEDIAREMVAAGMTEITVADATISPTLLRTLARNGVGVREERGYRELAEAESAEGRTPRRMFPGEAGREIAGLTKLMGGGR